MLVSVEEKSTGEVISGVSKVRKAEGCSLQACNKLKRNSIKDHFQKKPTGRKGKGTFSQNEKRSHRNIRYLSYFQGALETNCPFPLSSRLTFK